MDWKDRIEVNPDVLVGKPVVRGTRISVELILGFLADGWSEADLLRNYPSLSREDIGACLRYATAVLEEAHVYPLPG